MTRDPTKYQVKTSRGFLKITDATMEELQEELMRHMDVVQHLEDGLQPLTQILDALISGQNLDTDRVLVRED